MTAYYPPRPPYPPQTSVNPWVLRLPLLFISGLVLTVAALVALLVAFQLRYSDRIMPGAAFQGLGFGGLTRAEAKAALQNSYQYDNNAVFTFRYGEQFWQATAGDLGVQFDADATLDNLYSAGRGGDVMSDLWAQASLWLNGRSFAPIIRYDQNLTLTKLNAIAADINRPALNATLTIEGTTVTTTAGQSGLAVNIPAALEQVNAAIQVFQPGGEIQLPVHEVAPAVWDAETAASKIRAALTGPVTFVADNPSNPTVALGPWTATVDQIRAVLSLGLVDNGDGTQSYLVNVNTEAFRGYLETLAPGLISFPKDGRFHFSLETGRLSPIQSSIAGRSLNVDASLTALEQAIFNPISRIVPLVFDYNLPRYNDNVTAAELGITQLVADATTYYTGSTRNRIENIIQAAARMDGIIIAPGEEFSFNTHLGDISPETGFVQGKIIFGGQTIDGVGGGVCQVSTTIFRAALKGGFPITERNSHGYRVGFYEQNGSPPGLDAAIFQPTADFRFINDTPYHLLIETTVFPASDSIQFRLYSTNPGRQVVIEGPVVRDTVAAAPTVFVANSEIVLGQQQYVDWAAEGADVTFTRRILDANGQEIRADAIYTHYLPWAAVVQVAPGDPRINS